MGIAFAAPSEARLLPEALDRAVGQERGVPPGLLGPKVVAAKVLGPRARVFLSEAGLLKTLTPAELHQHWASGALAAWYDANGKSRDAAYVRLIAALADLDVIPEWASESLSCLRSADAKWQPRRRLRRYPPNWANLSPSPGVAAALEPLVGTPATLLDWKSDQLLTNDPQSKRYLERMSGSTIEQVAGQWWASLSPQVTPDVRGLVVEFTELLRRQRMSAGLVPKVLAVQSSIEGLWPIEQALLAEPYAGVYRRHLFPDEPVVSDVYLATAQDATDADLRAFFESLKPGPKGRPTLDFTKTVATPEDAASVGGLPERRATRKSVEWQGLGIDASAHYLVDKKWPAEIVRALERPSPLGAVAMQRWIIEYPGFFRNWHRPSIVFIQKSMSSATSRIVPRDSLWLADLKAARWLFDQAGGGPYPAGRNPRYSRPFTSRRPGGTTGRGVWRVGGPVRDSLWRRNPQRTID